MPNPGQELATIDFESMLGGPLIAVVNAQAQAAMSSVNFIKEVGFKKTKDNQDPGAQEVGEPIYVTFKYPKEVSPYQPKVPAVGDSAHPNGLPPYEAGPPVKGDARFPNGLPPYVAEIAESAAKHEIHSLEVPILTMLPIPFIRIELATVDFNAKINSIEYRKTDTNLKIDAALEAKAGCLWGSAKLKVSSSYQRSTQEGASVERTYSMAVHIKAVQDEMPAGMEKILGILEDAIKARPVKAPAPVIV